MSTTNTKRFDLESIVPASAIEFAKTGVIRSEPNPHDIDFNLNAYSPWPGHWIATPDGYDGAEPDNPKHADRRIGTGATKWDALRELIDAMESDEERTATK